MSNDDFFKDKLRAQGLQDAPERLQRLIDGDLGTMGVAEARAEQNRHNEIMAALGRLTDRISDLEDMITVMLRPDLTRKVTEIDDRKYSMDDPDDHGPNLWFTVEGIDGRFGFDSVMGPEPKVGDMVLVWNTSRGPRCLVSRPGNRPSVGEMFGGPERGDR